MNYHVERRECMWEKLASDSRPIVLYGTGNGADKLRFALEQIGRTPAGVFASDGFVRNRTYGTMPVLSYEEALHRFGEEMIVLIAFGSSLSDVMAKMDWVAARHETYIPELPLFGEELFTYDYYTVHEAEISRAYSLLSDESSQALFRDMLDYRLRGEVRFLSRTETPSDTFRTLLCGMPIRTAIDGGAFKGDSAAVMEESLAELSCIYAVEPDRRSYAKLCAYADTKNGLVRPIHAALSDHGSMHVFSGSGSRGAGLSGTNHRARTEEVQSLTIDALCREENVERTDLIKLDVEGEEMPALRGAAEVIHRDRPALAISLYHRAGDLFRIPLWIEEQMPGAYRYHLRRAPCYPAWDLLLVCVPV